MEENNLNQNPEPNVSQENTQTSEQLQNVDTNSTVNTTQTQATQPVEKKINICCLLSFIFSMVGIIMLGLPCGITATILGIIGITTFKEKEQTAKWMGITGLSVGAVEVVIMLMYVFLMGIAG